MERRKVIEAISAARSEIVMLYPFYGSILMNLRVALADCGTAATDMRRLIFDPQFVLRLSSEELQFVMMHEVMHNVLRHCIRGADKISEIYNVAADIVVNSNIMKSMGVTSFAVDGCEVMHKAPDGKEGYMYSAEDIYDMLLAREMSLPGGDESSMQPAAQANKEKKNKNQPLDRHDLWGQIKVDQELVDELNRILRQAIDDAGESGLAGMPMEIRRLAAELPDAGRVNWRELLHDFVQTACDDYDYSFNPVDRRYSDSEFLLPAFNETESYSVEDIWFVVDTSASVEDEALEVVYAELKSAVMQFTSFKAMLSFFDLQVTEPVEFDDVDSLMDIKPVGGGGTDFDSIFEYMADNMDEKLPRAVIILTDGYAEWPAEEMSQGVPVLWIIVDSNRMCPWGLTVQIEDE